ncbi:lytic murein transglycosylase [Mesorhizobium sp. M8A.F.Ca.ET.213.01.1.1]|nr:lytic murein transglycosylase [Mesorhizobium sp. M8A.F.Ca.ET.218.01.1.1]TGT20059.1 lytic murein transglycosylase [Mesorhizobium sp. M8A.F.Ca.ET.213.01.1.1]
MLAFRRRRASAPLCPAGHLPHLGGDRMLRRLSPNLTFARKRRGAKAANLPPRGEISGRTEGGAVPPATDR